MTWWSWAGTVKRRDLVGAVDQVDRKVIEDRSTGTLARALQGQLPGLNHHLHRQQTHARGVGQRPRIGFDRCGRFDARPDRRRGGQHQCDQPSDVGSRCSKTLSSAVYGARGAFGVVTTKSAKKGTPVINYNGSVTINRRTVTPDVVTDGLTWINWWKDVTTVIAKRFKALTRTTIKFDILYRTIIRNCPQNSTHAGIRSLGTTSFGSRPRTATDFRRQTPTGPFLDSISVATTAIKITTARQGQQRKEISSTAASDQPTMSSLSGGQYRTGK